MTVRQPILELRGIAKSFGATVALDAVDFTLLPGEVHVLVGENGAGKSTLVKVMSGATRPDTGTLLVQGAERSFRGPREAMDAGVATVYQEFSLVPHLTVTENLFLGRERLRGRFLDRASMSSRTRELIDGLDIGISPHARIIDLGVAQLQMVEIMRALIGDSFNVLILDEPTAALARHEIDVLFRVVRSLAARGVGIVYISHRLEEIHEIGHRVTVLRDGRRIVTRDVADVDHDALVEWMVGRSFDQMVPTRSVVPDDERLAVHELTLHSGRARRVTFTVRAGEVLGVFGLMGAGRTETMRGLFGVDRVASGRVLVDGRPVTIRSARQAFRSGLGMAPEDRQREGIIPDSSLIDNISLSSLGRVSTGPLVSQGAMRRRAGAYIQRLRITASGPDAPLRSLSGGNQQKSVLARLLAADSDVLILDEPTRGIDVGAKHEVYELINDLARAGKAVVFVSSDLPEVVAMADRVAVFQRGRLVTILEREEVTEETVLRAAVPEKVEADDAAG